MHRLNLRAALVLTVPLVFATMLVIACSDDDGTQGTIAPGPDGAADRRATGNTSGGPVSDDDDSVGDDDDDDDDVVVKDAGKDADAGRTYKPLTRDAAGPEGDGGTCSFNWDCKLGLRCECDGECMCKPGKRGAGKPGGNCAGGNDCVSAICINDALCSDECKTDDNCPDSLPDCLDVAFVGRICSPPPP